MREIDKILDDGERVFWEGVPEFLPFLFGRSIVTTVFGLFWMVMLIPFIAMAVLAILKGNIIGFGILLLPHFWVGIFLVFGIPAYNVLVHKNMYYAITERRAIIQKGLVGRDFEIVDFDKITNAEVNVGVFDKLFNKNSGSIFLSTAGSSASSGGKSAGRPHTLSNVRNPYEVFKFFKKVSYDVKTDIEYPNKLRPEVNPGYGSRYEPGNGP